MISGSRIGNWARWSKTSRSSSHSMTAIVCESMRRNSLGEVWAGHSGEAPLDEADAMLVERAWKAQHQMHRDLLRWHYIRNAAPGFICRRLNIRPWPTSHFRMALAKAESELEATLQSFDVSRNRAAQNHQPKKDEND